MCERVEGWFGLREGEKCVLGVNLFGVVLLWWFGFVGVREVFRCVESRVKERFILMCGVLVWYNIVSCIREFSSPRRLLWYGLWGFNVCGLGVGEKKEKMGCMVVREK